MLNRILAPKPTVVPLKNTKHIEYVEGLWNTLTEAKNSLAAKEDYIRSVANLGVRPQSVQTVADTISRESESIHRATGTLNRIKLVLNEGAEPTTPPEHWYCGHIEEPKKVKSWSGAMIYPRETWKSRRWDTEQCFVFKSAIPATALQKYAATKPHLDDARIYSPDHTDFDSRSNPVPRDPVLIGKIEFLGVDQFFEIARWDIDQDLAKVFSK